MAKNEKPIRVTAVVSPDDMERIRYWAEKKDMSVNEYVRYALDLAIRRENLDYDLPSLEAARINQITELVAGLSMNVKNLEDIVVHGFDGLLRLTRGENYLMDDTGD